MSSINFDSIDQNYPVAGQDNNSQGFRDNFTFIKSAFTTTKAEITALETNTAKLNDANDFGGGILANAQLEQVYTQFSQQDTFVFNASTGATPEVAINVGDAEFFNVVFAVSNATPSVSYNPEFTVRLSGWPVSGLHANIKISFEGGAADFTPRFTFVTTAGTFRLSTNLDTTGRTLSTGGETKVVELYSNNGGITVFANLIGTYAPPSP
jgi:hypothetical protein